MKDNPLLPVVKGELLHIAGGAAIALALLIFPKSVVIIGLAVVTFLLVFAEAIRFVIPSLNAWFLKWLGFIFRERKGEGKKVTGTTYFLLASLFTALIFPRPVAVTAIFYSALGDPLASLVGTWHGKIKIYGKSLEGDAACLIVCLATGAILAFALNGLTIWMAVAGAFAATIFQALNFKLNDNVTITVGSAFVMWLVGLF